MKKKILHLLYPTVLVLFTAYVLLDAFVIPRSYSQVTDTSVQTQASDGVSVSSDSSALSTDMSYQDDNISIKITQYRENDTDIYVADVTLSDISYLKTAFAQNTYGKNINEKTSVIASESNAILAINGDYYGVRSGYVLRNGILYRSDENSGDQQDLVIDSDGNFKFITEGETSAESLSESGAWQVLSFGPGLVENGELSVDTNAEVDKAKNSNPRTAIGIIDNLHYVFVVADGRTSLSAGLSLYQLGEFMQGLGVKTAYNLDGGGSSTMVFNGTVINQPTSGKSIKERAVSDIVYIG